MITLPDIDIAVYPVNPVTLAAGTYNNLQMNQGTADAESLGGEILNLKPSAAGVIITGIDHIDAPKIRAFDHGDINQDYYFTYLIRNCSTMQTITLKHNDMNSMAQNRFYMQSETDKVLQPREWIQVMYIKDMGMGGTEMQKWRYSSNA